MEFLKQRSIGIPREPSGKEGSVRGTDCQELVPCRPNSFSVGNSSRVYTKSPRFYRRGGRAPSQGRSADGGRASALCRTSTPEVTGSPRRLHKQDPALLPPAPSLF